MSNVICVTLTAMVILALSVGLTSNESDFLTIVQHTIDYGNAIKNCENTTNRTHRAFVLSIGVTTEVCDCSRILASFAALVLSVPVDLNISSASSDIEVTTSSLESTTVSRDLELMSLPFAQSLKNPCSWDSEFVTPPRSTLDVLKERFKNEFYRFVNHYATVYRETVKDLLYNHTMADCDKLIIGDLPHTPTFRELQDAGVEGALNKIYLSLLVHSTYSHLVHQQFDTKPVCSRSVQLERTLANETLSLALKQKALACYVRVGMIVLEYRQGDILPLLNAKISDLSQCSKRNLRDCQVIKSMYNFLGTLSDYVRSQYENQSSTLETDYTTLETRDYATTPVAVER